MDTNPSIATFGIWTEGYHKFMECVNFQNTCLEGFKFTVNYSFEEISFLDTIVRLDKNGNIDTSLYRKPTDTYNYVLFNSAHPLSCKSAILYSQFLRIRRICTNLNDFDRHSNNMSVAFLKPGYPQNLVSEAIKKA